MTGYRQLYNLSIVRRLQQSALSWPLEHTKFSKKDVKVIEEFWRDSVLKTKRRENGSKKYVLSMFPYPSGNLHMGHVRVYTISDCFARFYSLNGHDVIHPMGWDAFGLPAENAAIERGLNARVWTQNNIETMRSQLLQLGCNFDWDRELSTCEPNYYRWTQWLFLRLYEAGLVDRRLSVVNWDPVDRTVLADEQIDADGCSWRSGARAQKRVLRQWFIRTSRFASQLLQGLQELENWGDVALIQSHWIGECQSYAFDLPIMDNGGKRLGDSLHVLLSDVRELCKARAVLVKSSHVLCVENQHQNDGCQLPVKIWNPVTSQAMPVLVSDTVDYGQYSDVKFDLGSDLCSMSKESIVSQAQTEGWGGYLSSDKLKDWAVSRQRYWGTPIPVVHCNSCKEVPVPVDELPVVLPDVERVITNEEGGVLSTIDHWVKTVCPNCGGPARRETDTLDTFFDSAWYFLRYLDPKNSKEAFDLSVANEMMPVDLYVGGKEHAAVHLFFARFMSYFLHSEGYLKCKEPFSQLLAQGIVHGRTYRLESTGKYLRPDQITTNECGSLIEKESNQSAAESWEKMSKSRHNGVDPINVLEELGTDVTRLIMMSNVSPQQPRNWEMDYLKGVEHWLSRVYWCVNTYVTERIRAEDRIKTNSEIEAKLHESYNYFVRVITYNMRHTRMLNVVIARLQGLTNVLRKCPQSKIGSSAEFERSVHSLVIMLAVFTPHLSAELWTALNSVPAINPHLRQNTGPVFLQQWPVLDDDADLDLDFEVDGIRIGQMRMKRDELDLLTVEQAEQLARKNKKVADKLCDCKLLDAKLSHIQNYGSRLVLNTDKKY